jgi:hypothetical protein
MDAVHGQEVLSLLAVKKLGNNSFGESRKTWKVEISLSASKISQVFIWVSKNSEGF